jgi:hypothetical protein
MSFSFSCAGLVHSFSNTGCKIIDFLLDLPFNFCIWKCFLGLYGHPSLQNKQNLMDSGSLVTQVALHRPFATCYAFILKQRVAQDRLPDFRDPYSHVVSLICRMKSNNKPAQSSDVSYVSSILACRILRAMQPTRSLLRWSDDLHKIFVEAVAHQGGPYGLVS